MIDLQSLFAKIDEKYFKHQEEMRENARKKEPEDLEKNIDSAIEYVSGIK